ncbi:MAG TPA: FkbM family methyltransferase [Candidatus Deferrimicrobiaceae bacterium]|nr:FkbM family methyltransferase [Candidatus Deferrimicrobiaceae bacterium]
MNAQPVHTRFGFDVVTDEGDALRLRGRYYYEKEVTEIIVAEVRPGETAVDVGAMIGYHTLSLARAVGPGGRVWAFEPLPSHFKVMKSNLELNSAWNCGAVLAAASARTGSTTLHLSGRNAADNAIFRTGEPRVQIEVKAWRLDEFFGEHCADVSFMKVDTQGAESMVLSGAGRILENRGLRMVVEYYPKGLAQAGSSGPELMRTIREAGFEAFEVNRQGKEPRPATEASLAARYSVAKANHCNLFCRRPRP